MIFHENRLTADDSHEISCLLCFFLKSSKILNCCLLQIIGGVLWIKRALSALIFLETSKQVFWQTVNKYPEEMQHNH